MRVADQIVAQLVEAGVDTVFMVPGGGAMHLNDAVGLHPEIAFVSNLHEQASAIAAESYAKVRQGLGACLVTTGPGSTNALTGLVGAWLDSTPVVFVAGQVKTSDSSTGRGIRSYGVQEVSILPMVASCTKAAIRITDPQHSHQQVADAILLARQGRPGPVWIEVPLDVQAMPAVVPPAPTPSPAEPMWGRERTEEIEQLIGMVKNAERPVVLLGNGVRLSGCADRVVALAKTWNIPVLLTWLAIDLLEDDDPFYVGRPGTVASRGSNFAIQNSDLLISIGARLDPTVTAFMPRNFARHAKKVVVDIDVNEVAKLDMDVEQAYVCDAGLFVEHAERLSEDREFPPRDAWWSACRRWKETYPIVMPKHRESGHRLSTYAFSEALSDVLIGGETIVSGSSGSGIEIFLHAFKVKRSQRLIHTTALGSMGFALPSVIGAYVADPARRIMCVDGDGGFFFNVQELEVIRRLRIPVKMFVLNNDGYSSIRNSQTYWFEGRLVGADATSGTTLPSICDVANSFGFPTEVLQDGVDLHATLARIFAIDGPCVIEVRSISDEAREPRVSSVQLPDGTFVSRPMEDLFPFLDRDSFRAEMIVGTMDQGSGI